MNKDQLIKAVSAETGIDPQSIKIVLEAMLLVIINQLKAGNNILLRGFGYFCIKERAPSKGQDFRTGQVINIPGRKLIKFNTSKEIINYINLQKK